MRNESTTHKKSLNVIKFQSSLSTGFGWWFVSAFLNFISKQLKRTEKVRKHTEGRMRDTVTSIQNEHKKRVENRQK